MKGVAHAITGKAMYDNLFQLILIRTAPNSKYKQKLLYLQSFTLVNYINISPIFN